MLDSPTSQYRNQYIFYLITQLSHDFSQLQRVTWNYSDVRHGKGGLDGVGATLKRTADCMVMYAMDVGTFDQCYYIMQLYMAKENLKDILYRCSYYQLTYSHLWAPF